MKLNIQNLTRFSLLAALTVILQLFANIAIPTLGPAGASLNFTLVPIVLAGMTLGIPWATALGAISGLITTLQVVTGQAGLFSIMFAESPVMIVLVCMLKITVAALIGSFVFRIIKNKRVGTFVSAAITPTVNTGLFILGMLLLSGVLKNAAGLEESANVLPFILSMLVGFNYLLELAINLILAPMLYQVDGILSKTVLSRREDIKNAANPAETGEKTAETAEKTVEMDEKTENGGSEN